jgi:hypothetical protein
MKEKRVRNKLYVYETTSRSLDHLESHAHACDPIASMQASEAPDFEYIEARHWWGKHVTAAVDTSKKKEEVTALQTDLNSVLARMNVSSQSISCLLTCAANKSPFAENHKLFKGQGHDS